jgi:hypothetical protein
MRLLTAPRFLKMATTAFGAWWLFSRLAGLASHVTNQLCSRSSSSNCYHGKNNNNNKNNSHRVSENLTDVEHVMRSFRISGKNILLFLNRRRRFLKAFLTGQHFHEKRILKGLSHEIDFKNVDENGQILALTSAAAGFCIFKRLL